LGKGYRVRVVDNLATGRRSNLAHLEGCFERIEGDVADFAVCRRAVDGVDYVFHRAAIPSVLPLARHRAEAHSRTSLRCTLSYSAENR
jgi:UDP-glucose 4-epimerase